jgi:ABC-2 type transport system ATP-binding protein
MSALLEVKKLVKHFAEIKAVDGISFSIDAGTCFGLLGPNGAGKTTTIEIIEDVITPTSGEILFKGRPRSSSFRAEVGIQFQQTSLLNFLTVKETLETFKSLYQQSYDLPELVELCQLGDFLDQYNDRISGGQRQRFLLALALLNRPDLLFLDEPSTGLDPQARRNLWDIVETIKKSGKTVVLTTHYMEEAEFLCDQIAIMDYGRIIAQGSPETLIKEYCKELTIILPRSSFTPSIDLSGIQYREIHDRVELDTSDINDCIKELLSRQVDLAEMSIRSPNLENVFLNLTGRQLRE